MNATLIIPDIHERVEQLRKIDRLFGTDTPRIYLGDWFDGFKSTDESRQATVDYLAVELTKSDRTFLLGNHDCHYTGGPGERCSGYSVDMAVRIANTLPKGWEAKFKIYTTSGVWLLSHAGFNKPPSEWTSESEMRLAVGRARGGDFFVGGPLWLDWDREFQGIEQQPQIVGHTNAKYPRVAPSGMCLDCSLNYVATLISDSEVHIIPV